MSAYPEGHKSLLENLNPEQLAAVTLPHQSALILAGAGSGKTRVLTTRIAWLIQTGQVSPLGILAVTFTNKAAKEMLTRISAMLPINTRGMWVGTFHGLSNRLLRTHYRDAGLPQLFQILDTADQLSAVKRLMKATERRHREIRAEEGAVLHQRQQGSRSARAKMSRCSTNTRAPGGVLRRLRRAMQSRGRGGFPELLLRAYELLARNEMLRAHYQDRFRYILVDEFQDTNRLQYRWLKLFAGAHIGAVGGGRRRPVDLRVSRRAHRQHERIPARLRRRQRHQAGAELSQPRQHPRRRQRADYAERPRAWARTCGPRRARASRSACSKPTTIRKRPASSSKK